MRISDWSSDVCSSDLGVPGLRAHQRGDVEQRKPGTGRAARLQRQERRLTSASRLPDPVGAHQGATSRPNRIPAWQPGDPARKLRKKKPPSQREAGNELRLEGGGGQTAGGTVGTEGADGVSGGGGGWPGGGIKG